MGQRSLWELGHGSLLSGRTRPHATLDSPTTQRSPAATGRLSCQSPATRCLATAAGQRARRYQLSFPASPISPRAVCRAALHIRLCQQPGVACTPGDQQSHAHSAPVQHSTVQRAACLIVAVGVDQVGSVDHHAQAALILDKEGFAAAVAGRQSRAEACTGALYSAVAQEDLLGRARGWGRCQ